MDVLNRLIQTVPLTMNEWLLCLCAAASVVVVDEGRKLWLRRQDAGG